MPTLTLTDASLKRKPPASGQTELWDTVVPGFGLRIGYGGKRTFFVMTRISGRQVRRSVGAYPAVGLADARAAARHMLELAATGLDPKEAVKRAALEEERSRRQLFRTVAEEYLADTGSGGGANLRTQSELRRKLKVDVFPQWGDRPIREITRGDVRELLREKAKQSPIAANRVLALIRRVFAWALDQELIDASPAFRVPRPGQEGERERVLTLDEIHLVWMGCDKLGYPFGPLIKLAILTAQRRGEVAGLLWEEVDGNAWRLPGTRAKSGKGHLVPLSTRAVDLLEKLPRIGDSPTLAFTTGIRKGKSADGEPLPPAPVTGWSRVKTRLDGLIAEIVAREAEEDLDLKKHALPSWTLHDLRRSVATHLRDAGVDRLTVSKILNHAEGGMTRIYDRYTADREKRAALQEWGEKIERLVGLNVLELPKDEARA